MGSAKSEPILPLADHAWTIKEPIEKAVLAWPSMNTRIGVGICTNAMC